MGGESRHRTLCGSIITVFIIVACAVSTVYYGNIFLQRRNSQYMITEILDLQYDGSHEFKEISLGSKEFFIALGVTQGKKFPSSLVDVSKYIINVAVYSGSDIVMQYPGVACSEV